MKAAPALASGNVMITKASELNPISSLALGDIALQAGFPPGALNILVGGPDTGVALSTHMKIRKISFTGSIVVGQKIQAAAALSNLKRVTLELGGKSPVLVFADADLPNAIQNSAVFLTLNGQGCAFGTRIYVHESVADAYIEGLKGVIAAYTANLGSDPYDRTTWSCPLFNSRQKATVARFIEQGKTEAELLVGGEFVGDKGNYVQPTLFYKPKPGAQILKHEIFGPIAVIDTFKTEAEVLEKANDSDYGLAAELFTKDLSRAIRVSAALEAGTVVVNTCQFLLPTMPFGGHKSKFCRE
jgi:aldehyde dehydrogenase (NAD+)